MAFEGTRGFEGTEEVTFFQRRVGAKEEDMI